jgi:hypothetical protein
MVVLVSALALAFGPWAARGVAEEPAESDNVENPGRQALVGQWTLNADLSEDPREKMQEAMQKLRQGGGMGGGGGMRGGGMGGGGMRGGGTRGGGMGRGGGEGQRPPRPSMPTLSKELTITHIAPAVAIVDPDGLVRTLQPDGEKYQVEHGDGEIKTRWKGDRLVVETKAERGKRKETWSVSPETGRLTVHLEVEPGGGRMPKIEVDRVYDPVEAPVEP